ncbi:hypothetical protein LVJ94_48375 [Pendulispora rubella]|uniref:Uncharacterized protein n=1 Tax=Pendulispora rubella TaxID=2741070 RepID=A0ABZ2L186_9BACT
MLFMSDKPEKTAPKVEAKLRKDFASAAPLPYDVLLEGVYQPGSLGQLAGDIANSVLADFLVGGTRPLHTIRFHVQTPRPVEVKVNVIKAQAVCIGSILFSTFVRKPVAGHAQLEDEKVFGKSKLVGEPAVAARLNDNKMLIGKLNKFARNKYLVGNTEILSKRFVDLRPIDGGHSLLSVGTMPRSKWFGLASTFDASEFVQIADLVEASL